MVEVCNFKLKNNYLALPRINKYKDHITNKNKSEKLIKPDF